MMRRKRAMKGTDDEEGDELLKHILGWCCISVTAILMYDITHVSPCFLLVYNNTRLAVCVD